MGIHRPPPIQGLCLSGDCIPMSPPPGLGWGAPLPLDSRAGGLLLFATAAPSVNTLPILYKYFPLSISFLSRNGSRCHIHCEVSTTPNVSLNTESSRYLPRDLPISLEPRGLGSGTLGGRGVKVGFPRFTPLLIALLSQLVTWLTPACLCGSSE